MMRQRKNAGICWDKKKKATQQLKQIIQLEEINLKIQAKEGRLKRYRGRIKQYRQNRTFQNNERKFYLKVERECIKTYQRPDDKETKQFWSKIWE